MTDTQLDDTQSVVSAAALEPETPNLDAVPVASSPAPAASAVPLPPTPSRTPQDIPARPTVRPAWWNTVEQNAASAGVSSDVLWRISGAEGGHTNAGKNPRSSATGPFQITTDTWAALSRAHPELNLTDRLDAYQQAKAAPWLLRDKNAVIEHATGRKPEATESYLGWFAGEGGASKVLKADPSTPIGLLLQPSQIQSNPDVFSGVRTAGDLIAWSGRKMGNSSYKSTVPADPAASPPDMGHLNAMTVDPIQSRSWVEDAEAQAAKERDTYGMLQASGQAFSHETAVPWLLQMAHTPSPDPSYSVSPETLKQDPRLIGVPFSYQSDLLGSRSQAEFDQKLQGIRDTMEYDRKFSNMGLGGTALRMGAGILDPAGWAVGAALTPIGGEAGVLGYKLGRIGRMFAAGGEGAAAAMLTETPRAMADPTYTKEQMLYMGAGGALFGATLGGLIAPHPALKGEVDGLQQASASLMRNVEANVPAGEGSLSAARNNAYVEPVRADTHDFTNGLFLSEKAQKSALGAGRFDLSARTKNSDNPLVSALGGTLMEDAVGNADSSVAVARATSVEAKHLEMRVEAQRAGAYVSAAADYRDRNGIGWLDWYRGGEARFREQVADFIENRDPTRAGSFDPAVVKAGDADREHLYGAYADLGHNPGVLDGTERPPVRGMEENLRDRHYFPHLWDTLTFGQRTRQFGDTAMKGLLSRGVASALPELAGEQAERVGAALFKGLRNVQAGQEVSMSRAMSGEDADALRAFLQAQDVDAATVDAVVNHLHPPQGTGEGSIARTKRRTPLNALYGEDLRNPETGEVEHVQIKDLMERDYLKAGAIYNRQMAAQVALARTRIENPRWRAGDGPEVPRYLVDGIRGDSDWAKLRSQVFAVGDEMGHDPVTTGKDWDRLDFVYKAIAGQVHDTDKGKLGSFLRIVKDLNFMRVMNQVGFAQVADVGGIISQAGIKAAFHSMPAFREVLRDMKTGRMKLQDAQEIDSAFAAGTDWLRGSTHLTADDFGNITSSESRWGVAEDLAKRGTRVTSVISGMAPINAYIQRWATKAAIARFAYEADGSMALNAKRMRVLGLTEAEQKAVAGQIKAHRGPVRDEETGITRTLLNLDKWDDAGARHAFEYAVHTWSRKMVQENDVGQMTTVLGSTMGKLLFQFRMFTVAGYSKNTLHSLHMRDQESVMNILASSTLGGLAYAAQSYLQAQGRSDREAFLEKKLGWKGLASGAVGRAGWSSLLPLGADLGTYALGMDPFFDTRVTGSPSQGLMQFPTASLFDSAVKATRGAAKVARGEPLSQSTVRTSLGLFPFSNALPVVVMANALMRNLPEHDGK